MKSRNLITIIAALAYTGAAYSQTPDQPRPDGPRPDAAMADRIKSRIEQLRKDGKNEEADRMEKRVKEYKDKMSAAHHDGQTKAPDKAPDQKREAARKEMMSLAERMKKHLVEELRKDGKNEEADRVDAMAKKFAEKMAEHRSGQHGQAGEKGQHDSSHHGAKEGQASAEHGHRMHPPMVGAANANTPHSPWQHHGQWGNSSGHQGEMTPWAASGAWGHHRGQGGQPLEGRGHHRGHGGRGHHHGHGHRDHGFGQQGGGISPWGRGHGMRGGMSPWGAPGAWGQQRGQGHREFGGGQFGGMAPWGRGFGMRGGMPSWGGPQGRGFGMSHGMSPWGAPPPWAGQQHKKDGHSPKGQMPEHKGGMPPQDGPPAWGGKMPHHHQGGEAPKGDKPQSEGQKDGKMNSEHKGEHHHGQKHEDNKEEIRPAGPAGEPAENSVGEPPEV